MKTALSELGLRLKELRKAKQLSIDQVSIATDCSTLSISQAEHGAPVSTDAVAKLCEFYGVHLTIEEGK